MKTIIALIAGIVDLLANVPYILDALKGKTKPNIASWSTWAIINGVAATAAYAEHARAAAILGASGFLGALIILLIGLWRGTRKYTFFDGVCQIVAAIGLVLWRIFNDANLALVCVVAADVFAALPALRHAYKYPNEETPMTYLLAGVSSLGILFSATVYTFAALAVPFDFLVISALLVLVVLIRRHKLSLPIPKKFA